MDSTSIFLPTKYVQKSPRLETLDSLRGIAALIVVFFHCSLITQIPLWLSISPLRIIINGHASVILFFVLSGYVLSMPFLRGDSQPYFSYVIKRICRIYIPFAFSIFFALFLYNYSTPAPVGLGSNWFHNGWEETPLTIKNIINHLSMTGVDNEIWLNRVMWSLVVELRISIIFPILMYLSRFPRLFVSTAVLIYLITTSIIALHGWRLETADNLAGTFLVTIRFIPLFMAGIFCAKYHENIQKYLTKWTSLQVTMATIFVLAVFYMPTKINNPQNISSITTMITPETVDIIMKFIVDFLLGIASCAVIVLVRNFGETSALFNFRAIKWLGKISYSLYLIHLPLIFVIFRLFLGKMSFFWIFLIAVISSLVVASIFFILIEKQSIKVGKYLSGIMKKHNNA